MISTFKLKMAQIHDKYWDILLMLWIHYYICKTVSNLSAAHKQIFKKDFNLCHYECLQYTLIESEVH